MLKYILYEKLSDMHKYMHTYIQTREQIIHHTCMSAGEQTENIPQQKTNKQSKQNKGNKKTCR